MVAKSDAAHDFKAWQFPAGSIYVKAGISLSVAVLILLQSIGQITFSTETIIMVVIAILPWLSAIISTVEFPGGGKVAFRGSDHSISLQNAFTQMMRQITDLQAVVEKLQVPDYATGESSPTPNSPSQNAEVTRSPKIILWVDDKPANNAFEIAKLRADNFTIIEASSTGDAMKRLQEGPDPDVIITDMGRREGAEYVSDAGLRLIQEIKRAGVSAPVFCYTSPNAARRHGELVMNAGGDGTTSSPTELFQLIKQSLLDIRSTTT